MSRLVCLDSSAIVKLVVREPESGVLMAALGAHDGLVVGDNVPYSGREQFGHTIEVHASAAGLPNAMIEIRADLVRDDAGIARIADIIGGSLEGVLADPALYRAELY